MNIDSILKLKGIIEILLESESRVNQAKEVRYWYPLSLATYGVDEIIEALDYFDEKKMQYLRKKVLDMGNENIRNNDDDLDKFTIEFQFKN